MIQAIFYGNPDGYPPIINSTRLLAQAGYRIDILCRDDGQDWRIQYPATAIIHRLPDTSKHTWASYMAFVWRTWCQACREADAFVGHDMHGLLPARLLASRYRRPLIYHCHDFALELKRLAWGGRLVAAFERRWARTADLVIVPDAERGTVVQKVLQLPQAPLIVANAPLQAPPSSDRLRQSLQAQGYSWQRVVLRQGRVGQGHALEATIRSLPYWQSAEWGLAVLGGGDPAFIAHLRRLAVELDVQSQVAFLPPVAYDEVLQFTVGADLGHGLYEPAHINNLYIATASNKLMEYMAAGIPLLTSDRLELRELVNRYQCGVTADENAPANIAQAVNQLLANPEKAQAMGNRGRQAFAEIFCYEKQFAPVLAWLQERGIDKWVD
jgi:glycosyltransferase involved in cell wall biosynthesis